MQQSVLGPRHYKCDGSDNCLCGDQCSVQVLTDRGGAGYFFISIMDVLNSCHILIKVAGADLGFSRAGQADFQKKIESFVDLFLRSIKLIF